MDLNLTQLKTFYWVARLGGFRKAAETIHTSQPAVSARIAALEERLGTSLFERTSGSIQLTSQGRELLTYVEQISQIVETITENIADRSVIDTTLRLGVSETIVHSWLPKYLAALSKTHPRLSLELTVDVSVNLREGLLDRTLDLALLMGPVSEFTVFNLDLPAFAMGFFMSGAVAERAPPADLFRSQPVITFARNTRPFSELKGALLERYGPDIRVFPCASLSACIQMVKDGIGIGALPAALAVEDCRTGRLCEIDPGWRSPPLNFTASYVSDPPNFIAKSAAEAAQRTALEWEAE
jgi:DNA-binding transcriptional LysR family regulator